MSTAGLLRRSRISVALMALAALAVTVMAVPSTASAAGTDGRAPTYVLDGPVTTQEARQILLDELNLQRRVRGLDPLTMAANHSTAQCVSNTGKMSHFPGQCGPFTGVAGEVLAGGRVDHMQSWMNSTGHRDVLLRSDAASVRIGVPNCSFTNSYSAATWQMSTMQTERGANAYNASEPASQAGLYAYPDAYVVCNGSQLVSYVSTTAGTSQIPTLANSSGVCGAKVPNSTFSQVLARGGWTEASVWRLYQAYFLRQPDMGGYSYWLNHPWDMRQVANFFAESDEFNTRYGSLTPDEFVALVYENVMCRDPELSGFQYWKWQLEMGMGRGELMLLFSDSAEYRTKTTG